MSRWSRAGGVCPEDNGATDHRPGAGEEARHPHPGRQRRALDFATDAALRKALRALPGDLTVVIVSQRTSSIQHADQILVLDDGRQVGLGSHETLLDTCPVYREIYESQFKKGGREREENQRRQQRPPQNKC